MCETNYGGFDCFASRESLNEVVTDEIGVFDSIVANEAHALCH